MKLYVRLTVWICACTFLACCSGVGRSRLQADGASPISNPLGASSQFLRSLSGSLCSHDPTLQIENGIWYQFQTGPGIRRKISRDGGTSWEPDASVFGGKLSWWEDYVPDQVGYDVWAPDVEAFDGRVWLYYAISTFGSRVSAIGLVSASSLADADWRDEGVVMKSDAGLSYNAIDPHLFIDVDGTPWLAFGSWWTGIKLTRLDRPTMKPVGDIIALATRDGGIEAPSLLYHDGSYFLFVSVGRCCAGVKSTYQIRYGRAANLMGPYLDKRGMAMTDGGGSLLWGGDDRWIGPGGQDIHEGGILSLHAYDAMYDGKPTLGITALQWDIEGWPFL